MTETISRLPVELDNETVIFSYGSLLEHEKLREIFGSRGRFEIRETIDAAEAVAMIRENPRDIVILSNVRLENVRVFIVTETVLRRWYENRGGRLGELIDAGIITAEVPQNLYLYARPAKPGEKGRTLNGGLICNLSAEETLRLDKYEFEPVLVRTRAPQIKIGDHAFVPKFIAFYAGTESTADLTAGEKAGRRKLLDSNRKRGEQSPQARWRKDVRRG